MKGILKGLILSICVCAVSLVLVSDQAWATAQWGKKYGLACSSCHTVFPRLSYMGEKFMRDGYQFNQDGNEKKQEVSPRLVLDDLKHLFGIRLNLQPVVYTTNGITDEGDKEPHLTYGRTNWVQFFVAGSIYKNVSIFIENEITDGGEAEFSWYKMGFHNLFGPQGTANLVIGQQAPMEWMPASGRLRVHPDSEAVAWGPKSSGVASEDDVGLLGPIPALSFYGYSGPVIYFAGASPGDDVATDVNNENSFWAGARLEATGGEFEGSAVGVFGMWGTDAKETDEVIPAVLDDDGTLLVPASTTDERKNDWNRYSVQGLLRMGPLDLTAAWTFGKDDNWTLVSTSEEEQEFDAYFLQAAYQFGSDKQYYAIARYEDLSFDDEDLTASVDRQQLVLSLWYLPMENLKIGYSANLDLAEETDDTFGNGHHGDDRSNTHYIMIRTMF